MKPVEILFANLQSHEHTRFSLVPGINFILAEDNNVGKSTIFKVLSTIARAPTNNGVRIDNLIRKDAQQAYAVFSYEGERTVAWFVRGNTAGGAKLFFEYTTREGETSRHLECPQSLLDALGIVVTEDNVPINFNDADSVQLITKTTSEADAIITYVMQDQRVETMKRNMYKLSQELASDDKAFSARLSTAEALLQELTYNEIVDEFNESLMEIEAMCRVCDSCLHPVDISDKDITSLQELKQCGHLLSVLQKLESAVSLEDIAITDLGYQTSVLVKVLKYFESADIDNIPSVGVTNEDLVSIGAELAVCRNLSSVIKLCEEASSIERQLEKERQELGCISIELSKQSTVVECPVKGVVFYSDEKCVPRTD